MYYVKEEIKNNNFINVCILKLIIIHYKKFYRKEKYDPELYR